MSTITPTAMRHPVATAAKQESVSDTVMRVAQMTKRLLHEIHEQPVDNAALGRLRSVDANAVEELLVVLRPDLSQELQRLAGPITGRRDLSDGELRVAHAQLAGWLEGLLRATESDPQGVVPTASCDPNRIACDSDESAIRSARQTLVAAIAERIARRRLSAAAAAALLNLAGPKVTKLMQADADEFTLDELVAMLPPLELAVVVTGAPCHNGERDH